MSDPKKLPTDDDEHPHVDEDAFDPNDPGASKAGRGGIVSPGGTQPKPGEDPRKDAGLEPDDPEAQPRDARAEEEKNLNEMDYGIGQPPYSDPAAPPPP